MTTADKIKQRAIRAWTMYDWANSAFATTVMAAVLPNYFGLFIATEASLTLWGYTVAIGSLIAALISPVLGAIADFRGSKKVFMGFFVALGVVSTALLFFVKTPGDWLMASCIFSARSGLPVRWSFMTPCCRMWLIRTRLTRYPPAVTPLDISAAAFSCSSMWS